MSYCELGHGWVSGWVGGWKEEGRTGEEFIDGLAQHSRDRFERDRALGLPMNIRVFSRVAFLGARKAPTHVQQGEAEA